jgi:hypothetical protein
MKLSLIVPLLFASIPSPPPGAPIQRVDVTGKSNFELIGAGDAKIQIQSSKGSEILMASYPTTGSAVFAHFKDGRSRGTVIQRRVGGVKTVLIDDDGDGLPEVRHTFEISANGEERLTKIERLDWTSKEAK